MLWANLYLKSNLSIIFRRQRKITITFLPIIFSELHKARRGSLQQTNWKTPTAACPQDVPGSLRNENKQDSLISLFQYIFMKTLLNIQYYLEWPRLFNVTSNSYNFLVIIFLIVITFYCSRKCSKNRDKSNNQSGNGSLPQLILKEKSSNSISKSNSAKIGLIQLTHALNKRTDAGPILQFVNF